MARADSLVHSYALVVGSNRGGVARVALRFAEYDAERMAELFVELGRTPPEQVRVLTQPKLADLQSALEEPRLAISNHAGHGERSQVLFYYSGHARARALSLGDEEMTLTSLRSALMALPSTLTVVVSGRLPERSLLGHQGSEAAADFSVSSVNDLHSEGIAVMASSTAEELSQESPELASSYFSHHLVVALRGGGDGNGDGACRSTRPTATRTNTRSPIRRAPRLARSTRRSRPTVEVAAKFLSPTRWMPTRSCLPGELGGRVLVQKAKDHVVVAEILKAQGAPLALALPAGDYEVLVRDTEKAEARACAVKLTRGASYALDAAKCPLVTTPSSAPNAVDGSFCSLAEARSSGCEEQAVRALVFRGRCGHRTIDHGFLCLDVVELRLRATKRRQQLLSESRALPGRGTEPLLRDSRSLRGVGAPELRPLCAGNRREVHPGLLSLGNAFVSLGTRFRLRLFREWIVGFAEADAGLGIAFSTLERGEPGGRIHEFTEKHYGPVFRGALGMTFGFSEHFGAYLSTAYVYAPVLQNDVGDMHNEGGISISTGLRLRSLKGFW